MVSHRPGTRHVEDDDPHTRNLVGCVKLRLVTSCRHECCVMAVVGRCPWIDGWTCYGTAAVTRYDHVTAVAGVEHGDEHDGVEQEGRPGRRAGAQTPAHLRTTLPGFLRAILLCRIKCF